MKTSSLKKKNETLTSIKIILSRFHEIVLC